MSIQHPRLPEPKVTPVGVRAFILEPLDDQIVLGPLSGVRQGVIRVVGWGKECFEFLDSQRMRTSKGEVFQPEGQGKSRLDLPANMHDLYGLKVTYNLEAGWLAIERDGETNRPWFYAEVNFPRDVIVERTQPWMRYRY